MEPPGRSQPPQKMKKKLKKKSFWAPIGAPKGQTTRRPASSEPPDPPPPADGPASQRRILNQYSGICQYKFDVA